MKWRDLRPAFWGFLAAVAAESFLYVNYFAHEARFHWFTHFYVGGSVALLAMAGVALVTRRPVPFPLLWPILGHVIAMFPDFLFEEGIAHQRWMDVFLGHLSTHFIPGRNWTWYGIFLASLSVYLWTLQDLLRSSIERSDGRRLLRTS